MFWNNVKNELDYLGLSQKELSARTGINLGTLKNQICRNVIPDAVSAVKIAQVLNTTVEYLVTGNNNAAKVFEENMKKELLKTLTTVLDIKPDKQITYKSDVPDKLMVADNPPKYDK